MKKRVKKGSGRQRPPYSENHSVDRFTGEPGGPRSLELLKDRIETAAREINRLRQENAELAERMARLEESQGHDIRNLLETTQASEELREKIAGFIEAIERYLDEHAPESNPEKDSDTAPTIE